MWEKNRGVVLTAEACLSSLPVDTADMVHEAHAWLFKHGGINYGALQVGKGGGKCFDVATRHDAMSRKQNVF